MYQIATVKCACGAFGRHHGQQPKRGRTVILDCPDPGCNRMGSVTVPKTGGPLGWGGYVRPMSGRDAGQAFAIDPSAPTHV